MKLFRLLLRTSQGTVFAAVFCGVVSGAAGAGLILLITTALARSESWDRELVINFAALGLLTLLGRIFSLILLNRLHHGLLFKLRTQLGRRILATPLGHLENTGPHRLLATLADDMLMMSEGIHSIPFILIHLAVIGGCMAYLAWLSWKVFLGMAAFMTLGLCTYWLPMIRASRLLRRAREVQDMLFKHFRALSEGVKELKLHRQRRKAFLRDGLDASAGELRRLNTGSYDLYASSTSWGMFLFFVFIGLLVFAFPSLSPVTHQTLLGYVLAALYLQQPLSATMDSLPMVSRGNVALEKMETLGLSLADNAEDETAPAPAPSAPFERLELLGVTHTYHREAEDSAFTLGPIVLTLQPGEIVFVVGGNGSGKTTLAKLLTGLYVPESGGIRVNGVPVTDEGREAYRQLFSVVFSDFFLFETLLGLASPDMEPRVRQYLARLQLQHKVQITNGELSTVALSQGQRKRLALLTAYLEDRPVYVFDEWAADQDPTFREIFYKELLPDLKRKGKALLVITHDDRYFGLADRLIQLECGQIVSEGKKLRSLAPAATVPVA